MTQEAVTKFTVKSPLAFCWRRSDSDRRQPRLRRCLASAPRTLDWLRSIELKTVDDMLEGLRAGTEGREAPTSTAAASAQALARTFPLVHCTAKERRDLLDIFKSGHLLAKQPCTADEKTCGIPQAVYFFMGCAAYPEGLIAFLIDGRVTDRCASSFSPFDTGSLEKFARPRKEGAPWAATHRLAFLREHLADADLVTNFCSEYLTTHFSCPTDYVSRGQQSDPEYPTYHGLVSTTGDRRAWSLEVQFHEDVPLDTDHVEQVILARHDFLEDVPVALLGITTIAQNPGAIAQAVQSFILKKAQP